MNIDVVADVGNSRLKWGLCRDDTVVGMCSLPLDDPQAWAKCRAEWNLNDARRWVAAGVNPPALERFVAWLREGGQACEVLDSHAGLPLDVALERPEGVGLDRLFNAVAANQRGHAGRACIIVDAGSAVTVDWVDAAGAFRGGAIFPGLRLMAKALHGYTARLPLVDVTEAMPPIPGLATAPAIAAGLHGAVVGGILYLTHRLAALTEADPVCYLTGGDAALLAPALGPTYEAWPFMTLEGIRLSATARSRTREPAGTSPAARCR